MDHLITAENGSGHATAGLVELCSWLLSAVHLQVLTLICLGHLLGGLWPIVILQSSLGIVIELNTTARDFKSWLHESCLLLNLRHLELLRP